MINFILENYYGIKVDEIINNNYIEIISNSNHYILEEVKSYNEIEKAINLSQKVDYCNQFIKNIFGNITTTYDSTCFVLLKIRKINNIKLYVNKMYSIEEYITLNWRQKWIEKSKKIVNNYDYIKGKYPLIDESISYYMGMLEMSIFQLNEYENYKAMGYIQHRIIDNESFNNPLNLIIDIKERDFAEYIKYLFFSKKYLGINLKEIIQEGRNKYDFNLVVARLIMPNYYFYKINEIVYERKDETILKEIIDRNEEYINYIKKIIDEINDVSPIKKYPTL